MNGWQLSDSRYRPRMLIGCPYLRLHRENHLLDLIYQAQCASLNLYGHWLNHERALQVHPSLSFMLPERHTMPHYDVMRTHLRWNSRWLLGWLFSSSRVLYDVSVVLRVHKLCLCQLVREFCPEILVLVRLGKGICETWEVSRCWTKSSILLSASS